MGRVHKGGGGWQRESFGTCKAWRAWRHDMTWAAVAAACARGVGRRGAPHAAGALADWRSSIQTWSRTLARVHADPNPRWPHSTWSPERHGMAQASDAAHWPPQPSGWRSRHRGPRSCARTLGR